MVLILLAFGIEKSTRGARTRRNSAYECHASASFIRCTVVDGQPGYHCWIFLCTAVCGLKDVCPFPVLCNMCLLVQATAQLYEQGGLNHDMSFFLTAVGFFSLERPELQVRFLKIFESMCNRRSGLVAFDDINYASATGTRWGAVNDRFSHKFSSKVWGKRRDRGTERETVWRPVFAAP